MDKTTLGYSVTPIGDATVQERQVTLKVLTIGTKQITQSLYRQLPCDTDVIDHFDCELKGDVWGWVNLHIDCVPEAPHLHAIWERDGCLYRSCTYRKCSQVFYVSCQQSLSDLAKVYCYCMALEGRSGQLDLFRTEKPVILYENMPGCSPLRARVVVKNRCLEVVVTQNISSGDARSLSEHLGKSVYSAERCGYPIDRALLTASDIYAKMENLIGTMDREESRWERAYQSIWDAGQLFIAVSGVWK